MPSSIPGNSLKFSTLTLLLLSSATLAQTTPSVAEKASAAQADVFDVPEKFDDLEQLMAFVDKVDSLEPSGLGEQEQEAHKRKVVRTVVAAAERMLSSKLSGEDAMQCVYLKLQGLRFLDRLGEPKASERLTKAIAAAQADKRPDVQAVGTKFMIESGFAQWTTWKEQEKVELIERVIKYLSSRQPEVSQIQLVMSVVDFLGDQNGEAHAQHLMKKLLPHFKTSEQPEIQQALVMLEGVNRRMNLPGNTMKLDGPMLDGSQLDWASYRGKVVLVDYWATWCGPCRAEVPNVLKMYQDYHDKGFEVLGISLDESPEDAESYIKQTKIPWSTMFSENPEERGWRHPMAVRYGITGIPRAILVDREGKVVHMLARGENLGRELRRMLGEPVARTQQPADVFVQQASNLLSEE